MVSVSSAVQGDLALSVQYVDDLHLKVSVVHPGLPEGPSVLVFFPVVVPVPLLVCPIAKHRHLAERRQHLACVKVKVHRC